MAKPAPVRTNFYVGVGGLTVGGDMGSRGHWMSASIGSSHDVAPGSTGATAFSWMRSSVAQSGATRTELPGFEARVLHFPTTDDMERTLWNRAASLVKVLRIGLVGYLHSPPPIRFKSEFLSRSSQAVKGDALIHGPRLVAPSVGSEWRIHHLHHIASHINQQVGVLSI